MIYDDSPELYDAQYLSYRDDIPFYLRLADDVGGPILELGAGTGRVTEALARAGHQVAALDSSAAMLRRARQRLAAAGTGVAGEAVRTGGDQVGTAGQVTLLEADMRDFHLGRRFPLVIAPFNALMHAYTLDDQDRTLACVREHLEAGGVFAFDLYVPLLGQLGVLRSEPSLLGPVPESRAEAAGGRVDLFLVQHDDPEKQLLTSTYYLDTVAGDGTVRRSVTDLVQRYFTRFELERALRAAGFAVSLYGGFDRSRFDASSTHFVGLARPLA